MRALHFGAGNIGRGFIGLLLSRSGYNIVFIDVNEKIVELLNQRGGYNVSLAAETKEKISVDGVSAIHAGNIDRLIPLISETDLITTAVGVGLLGDIADVIAQGIERRIRSKNSNMLQIIACENAIHASSLLKEKVYDRLNDHLRSKADDFVCFLNTVVDRIVPIQNLKDPLEVMVEPYYEWLIDRSAKPQNAPEIIGATYVDQLEPYLERKLFTVNTGHSCVAYLGYLKGYSTIQEALVDPAINLDMRRILGETGAMLVRLHGLNEAEHLQYIDKIISRFRNPYLSDLLVRVCRSPLRKLSPNDRLVRPALQVFQLGIEPHHLCKAIAAVLKFDYKYDEESVKLQGLIQSKGVRHTAALVTGIPISHPIHQLIMQHYSELTESSVR